MKALSLAIEANTAIRDNYGLFDYDSFYYNHQSFVVKTNVILTLSQNKVKPAEELLKAERDQAVSLLKLQKLQSSNDEAVYNITAEQGQRAWLIVNRLPKTQGVKGYKLKRGDTFKIGRSHIRVKEIKEPSRVIQEDSSAVTVAKAGKFSE